MRRQKGVSGMNQVIELAEGSRITVTVNDFQGQSGVTVSVLTDRQYYVQDHPGVHWLPTSSFASLTGASPTVTSAVLAPGTYRLLCRALPRICVHIEIAPVGAYRPRGSTAARTLLASFAILF